MDGRWFDKVEATLFTKKNGIHYAATFHGSKEVGKGLEMKIKKEMGLK